MSTINETYSNALLADAAYVNLHRSMARSCLLPFAFSRITIQLSAKDGAPPQRGHNTHSRSGCFMRPAICEASGPVPTK